MNRRTRKIIACVIAGLLAFLMLFSLIAPVFAADTADTEHTDAVDVVLTVEFDQSEARRMLDMINTFRTGEEAYYWNKDNTGYVDSKGAALTYSYALEEIAMQRAAETALSFSHTRPDGTRCYTAAAADGTQSYGENIAAGRATAEDTFLQWREDSDNYSGQGHRRNMLNTRFAAIGIGHVVVNGIHYWAQEFARSTDSTPYAAPANGEQDVSVTIAGSALAETGDLTADSYSLSVEAGSTADLPAVRVPVIVEDAWPYRSTSVKVLPVWSSEDPDTALAEGQTVSGAEAGSTTLTAEALGKTVTITVLVSDETQPDPEPDPDPDPDPDPEPDLDAVTEITGISCFTFEDNLTVSVTARAASEGTYLLCAAAFDNDGIQTSTQVQEVSLSGEVSLESLILSGEGTASVQVFLMDTDWVPVVPCQKTDV